MKSLLYFLCLFVFIVDISAQKGKTFKIHPGEKVGDVIPQVEIYTYPNFTTGNVYFKNGNFSSAKLNYNTFFNEMQFLDAKGDTISIADENTIKSIVINKDTFYFDEGFVKLVEDFGTVKLANKQFFSFTNRQKLGGFGEESSASIDTYSTFDVGYLKKLSAREILTFTKYTVFYVSDKFNKFKIANKKNLLDLFFKNEKPFKNYLKENKVNFSSEDDLRKFIIFLNRL